MSELSDRLARERTLEQHREAISLKVRVNGTQQDCLDAMGMAITDLSAAVARLIDIELARGAGDRKRRGVVAAARGTARKGRGA